MDKLTDKNFKQAHFRYICANCGCRTFSNRKIYQCPNCGKPLRPPRVKQP